MSHAEYILELAKEEITFLQVFVSSDKKILRCKAETYIGGAETGSLDVIFHDEKKRQEKTLKKIGLTSQQLMEGVDPEDGARQISDYFILHDGVITGYGAQAAKRKINNLIMEYQFKTAGCKTLDLGKMLNECGLYHGKDVRHMFEECLYRYEQFYQMEQNHFYCTVNNAYSMTANYKNSRETVFCNTSIGRIFYDTEEDVWSMSKKEMERTGNQIENFDIEDVKRQLREMYQVHNMSELSRKLHAFGKSYTLDAEGIRKTAL